MAVPGSVVGVGKLITPGGQQGPKGDAGTAANVPLADITQNGLLRQNTGKTTDFVDGTNNCQALAPQIWSARLRSFNAISNPNFEVDQRNVGAATNLANGAYCQDRWQITKVGTMSISTRQSNPGINSSLVVPGTSFQISQSYQIAAVVTQESVLGAGDLWQYNQYIEGPVLRELAGDVTSISLLVATSVAGLKFSVSIRDLGSTTKSLVKLCTIPTAATWTLIQLPNIPVMPPGNFSVTPGVAGYILGICLASGTTFTAPAADAWQNGNFVGAPGMSNFAASPVNSTFQVAIVQHEPGPVCTTFIDKPFTQNLDECLRYYQKTYDYGTAVGTVITSGMVDFLAPTLSSGYGPVRFHKPFAKIPTMTFYNHATGAANSVQDNAAVNHASPIAQFLGTTGFPALAFTTATTSILPVWAHYTADTGW